MKILKDNMRKEMTKKRKEFVSSNKYKFDKSILENLIETNEFKNANTVFVYVSYNNEVDTHEIIKECIKDGKKVCVPKVISKIEGMKAIEIRAFDELKPGAYGILEPTSFDKCLYEEDIDLILLPGLAFDNNGGRLGYGGGFYDKFLRKTSKHSKKIGLAYDIQIVNNVPREDFDEKVNMVITDKKIIRY